tara:strand:+ start:26358 stop:26657 length:300 start_codon:yes stop_codon:yes gene_type:complete
MMTTTQGENIMRSQYKYTLTLRGFQTMQREAAHPFKGYEGGLNNIMKKAYWVNVTRGNKTIKRIIVQMKDGSKLYSLADWRSWNNNPHTILMRTLNEAK